MGKIQRQGDVTFNIHAGKRLRKARIELSKSQSWVADRIKVTFQQIQKYEKGKNGMSASILGRMAIILNTSVNYFYEGYDFANEVSSFAYKDNPPELHRGNQVKNASYYPDPENTEVLSRTTLKVGF